MNPWAALCAAAAVLVLMADPHGGRLARVLSLTTPGPVSRPRLVAALATWPGGRRRVPPTVMRRALVDVADAWAGELRAGRPSVPALVSALSDGPAPLPTVGEQIRMGADPVAVLHSLANRPGAGGARSLAACWQVTVTAGSGPAVPARRVADGLRDDLAVRDELQAQVAAPRATARLVAALPLAGPVLGALVGANTIAVLLDTPWGRLCLVVGVLLDLLGVWWVRRIVASAAPS